MMLQCSTSGAVSADTSFLLVCSPLAYITRKKYDQSACTNLIGITAITIPLLLIVLCGDPTYI